MGQDRRVIIAKGTNLLGVKAVLVESFERIHRSNLVEWAFFRYSLKMGLIVRLLSWMEPDI